MIRSLVRPLPRAARCSRRGFLLVWLALWISVAGLGVAAAERDLTFFVVSDTHYGVTPEVTELLYRNNHGSML